MNRRLLIFLVVFFTGCAAGFGYTYATAPTFVGTAMIQVNPGTSPDEGQDAAAFIADEAQALISNEMLENALAVLGEKHSTPSSFGSVSRLREIVTAAVSPGSSVIELQARGSEREQLALLLDAWTAAYLRSRVARRTVDRGAAINEARAAVASIGARIERKRRELDDFRRRHSIVSLEREENEVAAQTKGLNNALNEARNKAIDAESRLSAARAGVAEGKPVYRAQDKAIIAQLEQRALDLRQKLTDLERGFTPQYLAMDQNAKALLANLRQLEQQIEATRRSSQQEMLNEAAQDVATTRKNVARLEAQIGERRKDAFTFTSRFAEHKAQTNELAQLEVELGKSKQRLTLLERSERAREPKYELLGRPAVPEKPAHPDYVLYGGYTVGGALLAALLAVLLVEFLNPQPKPAVPAYPQPIIQIAYPALPGATSEEPLRLGGAMTALPVSARALPVASAAELRELSIPEVHALWDAATGDGRLAVAALFSGLTLAELASLRWGSVDVEAKCLQLRASVPRAHPLINPLDQELRAREAGQAGTEAVTVTKAGTALSVADLAGLVAAAAHDAGLEQAETIDADILRHTYVGFLVRQGARLSDLEQLVGPIPPASFLHYRNLSPRGPGVPLSAVSRVFPVFRAA